MIAKPFLDITSLDFVQVRIHSSQQVELLSRSTLINTETVWKLSPELDIWGSILRLVHLRRDLDARAQVQSLLFEHIPERQTPLVEGNSQAESMEAIYACEMVSFRYVLVCLLFGGFVNVGAWTAWKWNYLDDVEDFVSMGWIWTFFVFAVLSLFWLHILANH